MESVKSKDRKMTAAVINVMNVCVNVPYIELNEEK